MHRHSHPDASARAWSTCARTRLRHPLRPPAFLLGLLALTPRAPSAEPLLAAPFLSFDAGDEPYAVVIADLDADGVPDLAVANEGSNTVSVLLGNGDGTFATRSEYETARESVHIASQDLNGDARQDLVVVNSASNQISVLLGNGDGTFATKADYGSGTRPWAVAIGDLNRDGRPDLVVANSVSNS